MPEAGNALKNKKDSRLAEFIASQPVNDTVCTEMIKKQGTWI